MSNLICSNLEIKNNELYFGGRSTNEIASKYKTPLYVMDEVTIRANCRKYVNSLNKYLFDQNNYILKDMLIDTIYTQLALFLPQLF